MPRPSKYEGWVRMTAIIKLFFSILYDMNSIYLAVGDIPYLQRDAVESGCSGK